MLRSTFRGLLPRRYRRFGELITRALSSRGSFVVMTHSLLTKLLALLLASSTSAFTVIGLAPTLSARSSMLSGARALAAPATARGLILAQPQQQRLAAPTMGMFGLGAPELAIIAGVALFVLGPEQVKKLAKDVGKISAELKQVPEEFNKGMVDGAEALEAKKLEAKKLEAKEMKSGEPPAA